MQKNRKILIIDDNEDLLKAAKMYLKRHFLQIDLSPDPESIPVLLKNETYDLVLLDMNFTKDLSSGKEGFHWLDKILEIDPSMSVVLMTAYGDIQMAVQAIKSGASNFVLKPWENEKLLATIYASLELRENKIELKNLKIKQREFNRQLNHNYVDIIGNSTAIQKVFSIIDKVAKTDANVLILGENGTGKELIARAIHRNSDRASEPFISVDLGSVSESLFESELFGHKRGAFTDAKEDRPGRFEIASGGTLFLDEIGNLSLPLQAKLLTVLQNRKVCRVGSHKEIQVDIRLICATNMSLYDMVKQNTFRQDLIYRINTIEINVPPLRERIEDIPLIAEYFMTTYAKKYSKNVSKISDAAISRMNKHNWPGNIRELQHAIERAVIMSNVKILQPEHLDFNSQTQSNANDAAIIETYNLNEAEKILVKKALKKYHGNMTLAANELGITRASLYRRLEKHEL
ncbi:sigma-54-dependent transcriptional regulator [Spongiimicrobium salis]|uniref:sigma-54-dependent transcriptional regulator n=1 Tax=Spongiimicrobium salis TaxID=1667022 RepID=UPI00374D4FA5